jgi:hypothetical protein
LAEVAVLSEPVSSIHFPDIREKYREIRRCGAHGGGKADELMRKFGGLQPNSLRGLSGNFDTANREALARYQEN